MNKRQLKVPMRSLGTKNPFLRGKPNVYFHWQEWYGFRMCPFALLSIFFKVNASWSQPGPFEPLIADDLEKYSVINRAKNKKIV